MKRLAWSCLLTSLAAFLWVGVGAVSTSAQPPAPPAPPKKIAGNAPPPAWSPNAVDLKEGELVEFVIQTGPHGVVIPKWTEAKEFLEVEFGPQPPAFPEPAASTSQNAMLRLRVKKAPDQPLTVEFFCAVHGPGMKGKLTLNPLTPKKK